VESVLNQQGEYSFEPFIVINVNSTNPTYYDEVLEYAKTLGGKVSIARTTSNGKPGMGHNSCLELFRSQADCKYLFVLDGDDAYYPCAFQQFQQLLNKAPNTDIAHLMINDNISTLIKEHQHAKLMGNFYMYSAMERQENWWQTMEVQNPYKLPIKNCRTPSRILLSSRNIFNDNIIPIHYSTTCKLYDDFEAFITVAENQLNGTLNTVALSDPAIYCYNGDNDESVTFNFKEVDHHDDQQSFNTECAHYTIMQKDWDSNVKKLPWFHLDTPDFFPMNKRIDFCNEFVKFEILDRVKHGETFQHSSDYKNASKYYKLSIAAGVNSESVSLNFAICLIKIGKYSDAIQILQSALSHTSSDHYNVYHYLAICYNELNDFTNSKVFAMKANVLKGNSDPQMLSIIQKADIHNQNQLIFIDPLAKRIGSTKPILCFYTGYSDYFNGKNYQERTVYGSENAVVHLAEQMTEDYQVFVFCPCRPEDAIVHNNVTYMNLNSFSSFHEQVHINVMIVSRYTHFFYTFQINADKVFLWVHDARAHDHFQGKCFKDDGKHFFRNLVPNIDGIVCVSKWHKDYFLMWSEMQPKDTHKVHVINNSVDNTYFSIEEKKKNSFVWCSDTTRGLDILLKMFPRILAEFPDATLDIHFSSISDYQRALIEPMKNNVRFLGKIPERDLCKKLCQTDFWLYSNTSHETFAIVGLQATLAGCVSICRKYSGLLDSVGMYGKMIVGDPNTIEWQNETVEYTLSVMRNEELKKSIQAHARNRSSSWAEKYQEWKKIL
jgi:glycosyltransferase involved in cell wall biosynthesis